MRRDWRIFAISVVVGCLVAAVVIAVVLSAGGVDRVADGPDSGSSTTGSALGEEPQASTPPSPTPTKQPTKRPTKSPQPTKQPTQQPTKSQAPPAQPSYGFPIGDCAVSYSAAHHDYPATDIFAARGCAFVAPVDGVVDEVGTVDRWSPADNLGADRGGLFVSIVGVDGVRYYGSHLSAVAAGIRPGVSVEAGDRLGSIGETGSARGTGAHLHFGISWPTEPNQWWVRRGTVSPAAFLDAWRAGRNASPAAAVAEAEARLGPEMGVCREYC